MIARPPLTRAVVVVPAHDEAELLPACLAGLRTAAARAALPVEVVVVLDACTDASASLVPPWARAVAVDHASVGAARAAGFAAAGVDAATWCASTDADSVVGPAWLSAQVARAGAGADVVVGTVVPAGWAGHPAGAHERFEAAYQRADGHRHVHGASLGVRGSAYLALGGFAPLAVHEDVDLLARAVAAGAVVHRSGGGDGMVVHTSTRRAGRAPDGFAGYLRRMGAVSA